MRRFLGGLVVVSQIILVHLSLTVLYAAEPDNATRIASNTQPNTHIKYDVEWLSSTTETLGISGIQVFTFYKELEYIDVLHNSTTLVAKLPIDSRYSINCTQFSLSPDGNSFICEICLNDSENDELYYTRYILFSDNRFFTLPDTQINPEPLYINFEFPISPPFSENDLVRAISTINGPAVWNSEKSVRILSKFGNTVQMIVASTSKDSPSIDIIEDNSEKLDHFSYPRNSTWYCTKFRSNEFNIYGLNMGSDIIPSHKIEPSSSLVMRAAYQLSLIIGDDVYRAMHCWYYDPEGGTLSVVIKDDYLTDRKMKKSIMKSFFDIDVGRKFRKNVFIYDIKTQEWICKIKGEFGYEDIASVRIKRM